MPPRTVCSFFSVFNILFFFFPNVFASPHLLHSNGKLINRCKDWFLIGTTTSHEYEEWLADQQRGAFVVYQEPAGGFVLSLIDEHGAVQHHKVQQDAGIFSLVPALAAEPKFDNLVSLIEHFQQHGQRVFLLRDTPVFDPIAMERLESEQAVLGWDGDMASQANMTRENSAIMLRKGSRRTQQEIASFQPTLLREPSSHALEPKVGQPSLYRIPSATMLLHCICCLYLP